MSKTASFGPVLTYLYKEVLRGSKAHGSSTEVHCNALVLVAIGAKKAGCFREVAAYNIDHFRQVPLYN